jgi:hypothetical protein
LTFAAQGQDDASLTKILNLRLRPRRRVKAASCLWNARQLPTSAMSDRQQGTFDADDRDDN